MVHQWSLLLRLSLYFFPFGIDLESGPTFVRFLATWMFENINKQVLRGGRILGHPITDALHVVSLENRIGMIAKTSSERIHFAGIHMVHAQFIDVM